MIINCFTPFDNFIIIVELNSELLDYKLWLSTESVNFSSIFHKMLNIENHKNFFKKVFGFKEEGPRVNPRDRSRHLFADYKLKTYKNQFWAPYGRKRMAITKMSKVYIALIELENPHEFICLRANGITEDFIDKCSIFLNYMHFQHNFIKTKEFHSEYAKKSIDAFESSKFFDPGVMEIVKFIHGNKVPYSKLLPVMVEMEFAEVFYSWTKKKTSTMKVPWNFMLFHTLTDEYSVLIYTKNPLTIQLIEDYNAEREGTDEIIFEKNKWEDFELKWVKKTETSMEKIFKVMGPKGVKYNPISSDQRKELIELLNTVRDKDSFKKK